jgi:hypothetical protein
MDSNTQALVRWRNRASGSYGREWVDDPPRQAIADSETLADACLELLDPEPADLDFILSLGFSHCGGCQYTRTIRGDWTMTFFDDGPNEFYLKAAKVCYRPTRGQVRMLLRALKGPVT